MAVGARPMATMFRIVIPLARPGMLAGGVLVFISCLGAYLTPDLLGSVLQQFLRDQADK